MTTFLVTSAQKPTLSQISAKIRSQAKNVDILQIQSQDSKAIGIEKSREIVKFAQKRPMGGTQKLVVVFDAHKMTDEAQNALLKTLEEHADFLDIVLVVKNENGLLDTVISRCKKIKVEEDEDKKGKKKQKSVNELKNLNLSQRLAFAQKIAKLEKEEIVELLESWAIEEEKAGFYQNADVLLKCAGDFEQLSLNGRLALEVCFLKII